MPIISPGMSARSCRPICLDGCMTSNPAGYICTYRTKNQDIPLRKELWGPLGFQINARKVPLFPHICAFRETWGQSRGDLLRSAFFVGLAREF